HPLLDPRGDESYLLVLVTADKGLCGAFNTNLLKAAQSFIRENAEKKVRLLPVSRRGRDYFRRRNAEMPGWDINILPQDLVSDAGDIGRKIIELYTNEELGIDRVYIVYNEFRSVISQILRTKQLLPIGDFAERGQAMAPGTSAIDYIYEQP